MTHPYGPPVVPAPWTYSLWNRTSCSPKCWLTRSPRKGSKRRSCLTTQRHCRPALPDVTQVVVTGLNRRRDDMKGLQFGRAIRNRCPLLAVIYMAALLPTQLALDTHERFLAKPMAMETLIQTVRELLPPDIG